MYNDEMLRRVLMQGFFHLYNEALQEFWLNALPNATKDTYMCHGYLKPDQLTKTGWPQSRRKKFPEFYGLFQSHKLTFP